MSEIGNKRLGRPPKHGGGGGAVVTYAHVGFQARAKALKAFPNGVYFKKGSVEMERIHEFVQQNPEWTPAALRVYVNRHWKEHPKDFKPTGQRYPDLSAEDERVKELVAKILEEEKLKASVSVNGKKRKTNNSVSASINVNEDDGDDGDTERPPKHRKTVEEDPHHAQDAQKTQHEKLVESKTIQLEKVENEIRDTKVRILKLHQLEEALPALEEQFAKKLAALEEQFAKKLEEAKNKWKLEMSAEIDRKVVEKLESQAQDAVQKRQLTEVEEALVDRSTALKEQLAKQLEELKEQFAKQRQLTEVEEALVDRSTALKEQLAKQLEELKEQFAKQLEEAENKWKLETSAQIDRKVMEKLKTQAHEAAQKRRLTEVDSDLESKKQALDLLKKKELEISANVEKKISSTQKLKQLHPQDQVHHRSQVITSATSTCIPVSAEIRITPVEVIKCNFTDNIPGVGGKVLDFICGIRSIKCTGRKVIKCNFTDNIPGVGGKVLDFICGIRSIKCNFTDNIFGVGGKVLSTPSAVAPVAPAASSATSPITLPSSVVSVSTSSVGTSPMTSPITSMASVATASALKDGSPVATDLTKESDTKGVETVWYSFHLANDAAPAASASASSSASAAGPGKKVYYNSSAKLILYDRAPEGAEVSENGMPPFTNLTNGWIEIFESLVGNAVPKYYNLHTRKMTLIRPPEMANAPKVEWTEYQQKGGKKFFVHPISKRAYACRPPTDTVKQGKATDGVLAVHVKSGPELSFFDPKLQLWIPPALNQRGKQPSSSSAAFSLSPSSLLS